MRCCSKCGAITGADQRHKHENPHWRPPYDDLEGCLEGYETVQTRQKAVMSIVTTKYVRKPLFVDAVQITEMNFAEIAAWCQGEIRRQDSDEIIEKGDDSTPRNTYIRVRVHNPKNVRQTKAYIGDWLLYTEKGYKVYTEKAFRMSFDLAESNGGVKGVTKLVR